MASTMIPERQNRMPAKRILLPVISCVMPNSEKPSLMSGYAHPHAVAAVRANIVTHNGRLNIVFVFSFVICSGDCFSGNKISE
jgi:hypothetical protein